MRYLSVTEIAKKWDVSERSVRNYCAQGRVNGAFLTGKTWNIPENVEKPERSNKKKEQPITLLDILQEQKASKYSGGIYHKTQIELTYNSNHIEGSRLTHDQTRYIFETNTIGVEKDVLNVDDVIETANHFRCIDIIIDNAKKALTEKFMKELHLVLKSGTSDSRKDWFAVGDYKKIPNEVGGMDTALPEEVADKMKALLTEYNGKEEKTFEDILDFHVKFERIHPFQDGNGRVGRLIMFKECLKYNIVPFIIEDDLKMFYYRGLKEWGNENWQMVSDSNLYTYSNEAAEYFYRLGMIQDTIPVELNRKEILRRENSRSEMIIYGRLPLMITAQCIHKNTLGCMHQHKVLNLKDRYSVHFPVKNFCSECYNVIYNSLPVCLFKEDVTVKKIAPAAVRLSFTTETEEETEQILTIYGDIYKNGGILGQMPMECTNGHFKRGVE